MAQSHRTAGKGWLGHPPVPHQDQGGICFLLASCSPLNILTATLAPFLGQSRIVLASHLLEFVGLALLATAPACDNEAVNHLPPI
jgi:hypothetical protein